MTYDLSHMLSFVFRSIDDLLGLFSPTLEDATFSALVELAASFIHFFVLVTRPGLNNFTHKCSKSEAIAS